MGEPGNSNLNSTDTAEIEHTWNKVETASKKVGLREGISAGRESNFQVHFDAGFKEGFKNGYALGKYKGLLKAHTKQNSSETVQYPLLEKTSRGSCEVCRNEGLLEEDVASIIKQQTEVSNCNLNELFSTFGKTFKCEVPKSLDDA
ncbi:hypothetical protein NQ315_007250 [Exocentrus adspersus]|uniref:Essential protein Yae1 N-terminal domain-containing protein n=1 Tax=Exocentrus adspersus TaxID=1586481 RepID=A0AAV8WDQ5_9CUCU|nr:hypothetical protein NQ315_007250 [Exocentrus adspersus]